MDAAVGAKVRELLDAALAEVERIVGLDLSVESISPSIFHNVALHRLSAVSPRGATLLSAGRILVYYDIKAIVRGDFTEAVTALRIENARLDIDAEADRELIDRLLLLVSGGSGGGALGFSISGRDIAISLSDSRIGSASLDARNFELIPGEEEIALALTGDILLEQSLAELGPVRGTLIVSGSLAKDASRARFELGLSAKGRDFTLRTQRFEALYAERKISLRKVRDEAPLDAEFDLNVADGSMTVRLALDGYAPDRALKVLGAYSRLSPWLSTPYSGSVTLDAPEGDIGKLSYAVRLEGMLPPGIFTRRVGASIAATGDLDHVDIERARVDEGPNSFEYSGSFRFDDLSPDGNLDVALSLIDGKLPLSSSLRVFGQGGEYAFLAESAVVGDAVFRDIAGAGLRRGAQMDFELSLILPEASDIAPDLPSLRFSGEALSTAGSAPRLACEGSFSWGADPGLDASLTLESIDFAPLRALIETLSGSPDAAAVLGGMRVGGEVFLSTDFERLSWTAPDLALVSRSIPDAYALLSLSGNTESISVRKASISVAGLDITGSGSFDFESEGGIGFALDLDFREVPYSLRGAFVGGALTLTGDYGIEVSARRDGNAFLASVSARELPLPIVGARFLVSADAEGRFATLDDWSLDLASMALLPAGEGLERIPRLALSGNFGPAGGQLWDLAAEDAYSALSGAGRLEYSYGDEPSCRLLASLGSQRSSEAYEIDLRYAPGSLEGGLSFVDSPLARFGELPFSGAVAGSAALSGPLDDPDLSFDLKLRNAMYRDQPLSARAAGRYADGLLSIAEAQASYLSNRLSLQASSFSFRDGAAATALSYSGIYGGSRMSFTLAAEGSSSLMQAPTLGDFLKAYDLTGFLSDLRYDEIDEKRIPFTLGASASGLRLAAGSRGELEASYTFDGAFSLDLRSPLPVRFSAAGRVVDQTIDAEARNVEIDLPAFSFIARPRDFQILTGTARGSLRAQGIVTDPELSGRLDAQGVTLKAPLFLDDVFGPFDIPVFARGRSIDAAVSSVKVGKATVSLRAQSGVDRWVPAGITAELKTDNDSQVSLDFKVLGITVSGATAFDLKARFEGGTMYLGGGVTLGKASVLVSPEVWASSATAAVSPQDIPLFLSIDIDVGFSRGAQVMFPYTNLPVFTGYADRGSSLRIRYDQASNDLLLKGAVVFRGGEVFYIQRDFYLKSARMQFNETLERFDPLVTVLAELRDRNDEGPVLITLSTTDQPITTFKPRLSSNPTMTESQIALLLGQGLLGIEAEGQIDYLGAGISASEFLPARFNVTKAFENRIRESLGLDIFYLRTQVIQHLLVDWTAIDDSQTINPLGSYLDKTSLYAGKYLGDSIFVYGSAYLREDPLVRSSGLRLDSEFGAEFDTPFGILQWTLTPSSPENLFISDQSISLGWKLVY